MHELTSPPCSTTEFPVLTEGVEKDPLKMFDMDGD